MSYFAAEEFEGQLIAFLDEFLTSGEGERASEAASKTGGAATLVLRTVEPETLVSVDFLDRSVSLDDTSDPSVVIEVEADALHDILLERLNPVHIARLYETGRVRFSGAPADLAALVVLASALPAHYTATLVRQGRQHLLDTPMPAKALWGSPDEGRSPERVIGKRRAWQRPKRATGAERAATTLEP